MIPSGTSSSSTCSRTSVLPSLRTVIRRRSWAICRSRPKLVADRSPVALDAGQSAQAAPEPRVPAPSGARRRRRTHRRGHAPWWVALIWLAPALALIGGVVIYPVIKLIQASTSRYTFTGLRQGSAGADNFKNVWHQPQLETVLKNTLVWVVAVVVFTIVISLRLAQFLAKEFFGRRVVRWALIVPWAASLVITSRLFELIYDYYHGI